jgi:peptide deformylase
MTENTIDAASVPMAMTDYVDSRSKEEIENEPEAVVTTADSGGEPMVIDMQDAGLPATEEVKEAQELMNKIVAPHSTVSKPVTQDDVDYVLADAQHLVDLCFMSNGLYATAYAMAHPQIETHNPLRFFALASGVVVCNPVITRHTKHPVDSLEGCMTAPHIPKKMVQRYHKIEVDFQTIDDDKKLTEVHHVELQGPQAKVWQHEISHLNGHYCFDENFTPEHALPITN